MGSNKKEEKIVVIGTSTGGPNALLKLLPSFPANFPFSILIAQHISPNFNEIQAELMDQIFKLVVVVVSNGDSLESRWFF